MLSKNLEHQSHCLIKTLDNHTILVSYIPKSHVPSLDLNT